MGQKAGPVPSLGPAISNTKNNSLKASVRLRNSPASSLAHDASACGPGNSISLFHRTWFRFTIRMPPSSCASPCVRAHAPHSQ